MGIVLSGTTGIDAGSLPIANAGKISEGIGLPAVLNTAGVDRVTVDINGNVGVGVIPIGNYKIETPSNYLGSFRFGLLTGGNSGANYPSIGFNFRTTITSHSYLYDSNNLASMVRFDSGGFQFLTAPSGTAGNAITWTNAMTLDSNGNLLLTSGTGGLGYGTGSGGTVTQLTSKSTAVTLNKPSGMITMNNAALAAGATVGFTLFNSLASIGSNIIANPQGTDSYAVEVRSVFNNGCSIWVTNKSAGSLSEALQIQFELIKGATA